MEVMYVTIHIFHILLWEREFQYIKYSLPFYVVNVKAKHVFYTVKCLISSHMQ